MPSRLSWDVKLSESDDYEPQDYTSEAVKIASKPQDYDWSRSDASRGAGPNRADDEKWADPEQIIIEDVRQGVGQRFGPAESDCGSDGATDSPSRQYKMVRAPTKANFRAAADDARGGHKLRCIPIPESEWTRRQLKSYTVIEFDFDGRPRNPIGRTGIRGRGSLPQWGPNFAADLLVTRWKPNVNGILEVLMAKRKDSTYGLLGALLKGEDTLLPTKWLNAISMLLADHYEDLDNSEERRKVIDKIKDKLKPEKVASEDVAKNGQLYKASEIWKSEPNVYVDDPRATDNVWIESTVYHLHLDVNTLNTNLGVADWVLHAITHDGNGEEWMLMKQRMDLQGGLTWLEVAEGDGDQKTAQMYGEHEELAKRAKRKLMPQLVVGPLHDTRLVALHDPKLKQKMRHITGLMDEHYCRRLLNSLWNDADKPSERSGHIPERPAKEKLQSYKERVREFFKDRRNWSRWNLQKLVTARFDEVDTTDPHDVPTIPTMCGIQELVNLQVHTTTRYKFVFSMPLYVVSLYGCNNLDPYNDRLIPKDQLECLLAGSRGTEFDLSMSVFKSGSLLAPRKLLQLLKHAVVDAQQAGDQKRKPPSGLKWFPISTTRPDEGEELRSDHSDHSEHSASTSFGRALAEKVGPRMRPRPRPRT